MRIELERTEKIERFLLGLFTKEEENRFKQKLITDSDLAMELKWQKLLMKRIEKIVIKQEISLAHKKYMQRFRFSFKNKVFRNWAIGFFSVLVIALIGVFTSNLADNETNISEVVESQFAPIIKNEKPFNNAQIKTEEAVLLNYDNGTFIIIPSDAFIDEYDVLVTGQVEIKFREFNGEAEKPFIDQKNDSSALEPALMIEFYALKDGKPLEVGPDKEIEIIQSTSSTSPLFNIYQYDLNEEDWKEKGVDLFFELSGQVVDNQLLPSLLESLHIENPKQDPEILREQEAYFEILQQLHVLDSINNGIKQKHLKIDEKVQKKSKQLNKVFDLYRQRMVLLANVKNKGLKDTLIKIKPKPEALKNRADYLKNEYHKFAKNNLMKISKDLRFYRVYSINEIGVWSIALSVKETLFGSAQGAKK